MTTGRFRMALHVAALAAGAVAVPLLETTAGATTARAAAIPLTRTAITAITDITDPADLVLTAVIRGGQLFDSETGRVRPLGQLRIAGERIVGEAPLDAPIPDGVQPFDAFGCTVLPGLFDLHTHLMVAGGSMTSSLAPDPELNLQTHAAFGVLTAADLHNEPDYVFALRERTANDPTMARLAAAGAAFTVPGGHCTQFGFEPNVITKPADVATRFEALLARKPDVIKAVVEHGAWGSLPAMPTLDEPTLAAIAARASQAGVPLFCHVWTLAEAKQAARAGVDALVHGVYVGEVDDELIALMKQHGTGYVPTLAVVVAARRVGLGKTPYVPERLDSLLSPSLIEALNDPTAPSWVSGWAQADDALFLRNLKKLHAAGIRCGAGTDAGNPLTPHGPGLLAELELYVDAGLTPAQALQCATIESARLLRRERDFGSLAAGKVADVVVVRGDPTRDLAALWQIEGVLKAGRAIDRAALRERQLAPTRAPRKRRLGLDLEPAIDDFDDEDLDSRWGGSWVVAADSAMPGGKSQSSLEVIEVEGSGALLMKATLAEGSPYGAFAGATIRWNPILPDQVDFADATALVLRVRGTARSWTLAVERAAVTDYDVFAADFAVSDKWREVRVPLADLRQVGFGAKVAVAWNDVIGLTLTVRSAPGAKRGFGGFELELDEIRVE